jgi:hypothetical protein
MSEPIFGVTVGTGLNPANIATGDKVYIVPYDANKKTKIAEIVAAIESDSGNYSVYVLVNNRTRIPASVLILGAKTTISATLHDNESLRYDITVSSGEVTLSNSTIYINDVDDVANALKAPTGAVVEQYVQEYVAEHAFSGAYADLTGKPTIPTVPTKVSAFTNDAGYIKSTELNSAVDDALTEAKESGEFDGADGQRGTGILKVTTAPASYTTAVGDYTPKYRVDLSTVKSQASVSEVLIGDIIQYTYYLYKIDYINGSYAYISAARTSIRGATGDAGADGKTPVKGTDYFTEADKTEMVNAVITALPKYTGGVS